MPVENESNKHEPSNSVAVVFEYHDRTKHEFNRYARSLGYLDWVSQPCPFRYYLGAPQLVLPLPEDSKVTPDYESFFSGGDVVTKPLNRETLSDFFYYSLSLSAWKNFKGNRWSLRVNPSSGNLHPTECYLLAGTIPDLSEQPGVYHYFSLRHNLVCRATLPETSWQDLIQDLTSDGLLPQGSFLVALSSIHWRESWKYGERAFRYCQHDCGHALAAMTIAAGMMGWKATLIEGVSDDDLARLTGLNRDEDYPCSQERDEADLLVAITPVDAKVNINWKPAPEVLKVIVGAEWQGRAERLSQSHQPWSWIEKVTKVCRKPETTISSVYCNHHNTTEEILHGVLPLNLSKSQSAGSVGKVVRQRRSAVDMDGKTKISKASFYQILSRVQTVQNPRLFSVIEWPSRVHLGLFVHRVDGLSPGLYLLLRDIKKLKILKELMKDEFIWRKPTDCPQSLPLYQLFQGDTQDAVRILSCHQDIASDGVFSCAMLADFEQPIRKLGVWWYRRLFWETGMIGQMLYLEAEAKGIRATGIGCFFDDPVHQVFGLSGHQFQSLYHFTMGGPVDDTRLETLPAYYFLDDDGENE
ncbi:oxidoreductase [Photobacterium marinum]|uniref:Oxidoreductase n=1 Tax=Photobacterium marinum TaxID=1056511 RepID=L8J748_9GAMM|nr:SagB/ThcOx family dehydrogenase [Photobacterium marinum]ELR64616.1 oxidoreductase [Photobacterium marinum]